MRPARRRDFWRKSAGAAGWFSSTCITSRASRAGPIPFPTGWRPSVITTSSINPMRLATYSNRRRKRCASGIVATLAVGPTGMSSTRWVEPAATFFERMDATIWPGESIDSGRSTAISTSSAGDRSLVPPQARQPRWVRTMLLSCSNCSSTCASTSMVSAVPAGDVMAREEVFGHSMPCAATIGTTSMDVRLPGMPPMQCLSTTGCSPQFRRRPTRLMASLRKNTSSRSSSAWLQATTKAVSSIFE